jgi:hypothetical protein
MIAFIINKGYTAARLILGFGVEGQKRINCLSTGDEGPDTPRIRRAKCHDTGAVTAPIRIEGDTVPVETPPIIPSAFADVAGEPGNDML